MSLVCVLLILLVCAGVPVATGIISVICDRVTYGNWIWEVRKNG